MLPCVKSCIFVVKQVDLSTLEAEATLDLWEHQLVRLRNEGSVRTITRELHMAQSVPAVRIRAFKNGEGSRGHGEIMIGSSIHAVCLSGCYRSNAARPSRKRFSLLPKRGFVGCLVFEF